MLQFEDTHLRLEGQCNDIEKVKNIHMQNIVVEFKTTENKEHILDTFKEGRWEVFTKCHPEVVAANSMPTGVRNLGCGEGRFHLCKQLNCETAQL